MYKQFDLHFRSQVVVFTCTTYLSLECIEDRLFQSFTCTFVPPFLSIEFSMFHLWCSGCMDLHLFETDIGAWSPLYFKNVCFGSWIGHCMKLCYWQFTVLMPSLLSTSHIFLWRNDNQISSFLCVSSFIS